MLGVRARDVFVSRGISLGPTANGKGEGRELRHLRQLILYYTPTLSRNLTLTQFSPKKAKSRKLL